MPNTHPRMTLSPEEEAFLRHWIYDEARYESGIGPAKKLQIAHAAKPADIAVLIAAGLPDFVDQESAANTPPGAAPVWPWSEPTFAARLAEAKAILAQRQPSATITPSLTGKAFEPRIKH